MKKIWIVLLLSVGVASCTNRNVSQERQDSIEAAAAADSMLNDATETDTTAPDNVAVDTSDAESL